MHNWDGERTPFFPDMRSPEGRRFVDIFDRLALEFPDADSARLREVAVLKHAAEKALAVGAFEDAVRLVNASERKERSLREAVAAARARAADRRRKQVAGKPSRAVAPLPEVASKRLAVDEELARIRAHRVAFEQELAARIEAAGKQGGA
jgi:hypothetical protein